MGDGRPIGDCYWVEPGRLLAGEYPGHWEEATARRRIGTFLDSGVRSFIDLTHPDDPLAEYRTALVRAAGSRGVDARHHSFPIRDLDVPESRAAMAAILEAIRDSLEAGGRTYVHCWGGIGRTGVVIGCWLIERGLDGPQALAELARRYATMDKATRFRASPQTWEQVGWVRRWRPVLGLSGPQRANSH